MKRGDKVGRLIIAFEIVFPKDLSVTQKQKLAEIL